MLKAVKLLLPALIPSWRFFDAIAPSPRIEFAILSTAEATPDNWQEFHPRPAHLTIRSMLKRMVWNPQWNEALYLVSCAERLIQSGSEHTSCEIVKRIKTELERNAVKASYLQFRLVLVSRQGQKIEKHITFTSEAYLYSGSASS